ncbi:hypothetical protein FHG87_022648, partial [Trinorchestia longiramus]
LPQRTHSYVNLSNTELTSAQTEVLSLGCKFSYKPKFDSLKKQTELEILYGSLLKMENNEIITIKPEIKPLLRAEATKNRDFKHSIILTKELRTVCKQLKDHP